MHAGGSGSFLSILAQGLRDPAQGASEGYARAARSSTAPGRSKRSEAPLLAEGVVESSEGVAQAQSMEHLPALAAFATSLLEIALFQCPFPASALSARTARPACPGTVRGGGQGGGVGLAGAVASVFQVLVGLVYVDVMR